MARIAAATVNRTPAGVDTPDPVLAPVGGCEAITAVDTFAIGHPLYSARASCLVASVCPLET